MPDRASKKGILTRRGSRAITDCKFRCLMSLDSRPQDGITEADDGKLIVKKVGLSSAMSNP